MQLSLRVIAQGPEARATDSFILQLDDAQKGSGLEAKNTARAPTAKLAKPKPAKQASPASSKKSTGQASRFVQAKALSSRGKAQGYADKIEQQTGMKAFVRKTKRRNPPLYRVIIPAFARQDIPPIIQALKGMGIDDSFVTRD